MRSSTTSYRMCRKQATMRNFEMPSGFEEVPPGGAIAYN